MKSILPAERIERLIYLIRSQKVMLDMDFANLYDVETRRINEQVKRNKDRFPEDFYVSVIRILNPSNSMGLKMNLARTVSH